MPFLLWTCVSVALLGTVVVPAALALAMQRGKLERNVRFALATCVVAVGPGFAFVVHAAIRAAGGTGSPWQPYELASFLPAAFWLLVAPFVFARSAALARPLRVPRYVDGIRFVLMLGWVASSVLVVVAGLMV
jgi:hypothetical protein